MVLADNSPEMKPSALSVRLRAERQRLLLSQQACADASGVSLSAYKRWELDRAIPSDKLRALMLIGFGGAYILSGLRAGLLPSADDASLSLRQCDRFAIHQKPERGQGVADRLREERERLGHTQVVMASLVGASAKSQGRYEVGDRSPSAEYLIAVAAQGVDVNYVLSGVRKPAAQPSHDIELPPPAGTERDHSLRVAPGGLSQTSETLMNPLVDARHKAVMAFLDLAAAELRVCAARLSGEVPSSAPERDAVHEELRDLAFRIDQARAKVKYLHREARNG